MGELIEISATFLECLTFDLKAFFDLSQLFIFSFVDFLALCELSFEYSDIFGHFDDLDADLFIILFYGFGFLFIGLDHFVL